MTHDLVLPYLLLETEGLLHLALLHTPLLRPVLPALGAAHLGCSLPPLLLCCLLRLAKLTRTASSLLARDAALHGDDLQIVCMSSITEHHWRLAGLCASHAGAQFALHAMAYLQGEQAGL